MTSLSLVATGDTILASHHNQAYNLLKGVAGSGEQVTLLSELRLGAAAWATDGILRLPNDQRITSRNAANTDNHDLIYLNSANVVKVGADGGLNVDIGAGLTGAVTINGASLNVAGSFMQVGTNPAATGAIRIPNNQFIDGRNAANTGDIAIARVFSDNTVLIGDGTVSLFLQSSAGNIDFRYATTALGGGAAPVLGTIGGSGPGTANQNSWLKILINGTASYIPIWR